MSPKYLVVEITGHDGSEEFDLMTPEEFRTLVSDLRREKMRHSKALALTMRDWEKSEQTQGQNFPRGAAAPRSARKVGRLFADREAAEKKLARCEEKLFEKQQREAERKREKEKQFIQDQRKGPRASYKQRADAAREKLRRDNEREQLRSALEARALTMYKERLADLLAPAEPDRTEDKAGPP